MLDGSASEGSRLEVSELQAAYGSVKVLYGVSFNVNPAEIVCLLGRNGAGKSTTLKTIMGVLPVTAGSVALGSTVLTDLPAHRVPAQGIGYIPQGRRLFRELTVDENIQIGLMAGEPTRQQSKDTRDWVLELFPRLRERLKQTSGTLSGGEQQMLATARALCLRPKVLLMDEPSEGLQPSMIDLIHDVILKMKREGIAIVLVEQRIETVMSIADKMVFIENGKTVDESNADQVEQSREKLVRYLGV